MPSIFDTTDEPSIFDFLLVINDPANHVGRVNPASKDLELRHVGDLPAGASIITRPRADVRSENDGQKTEN